MYRARWQEKKIWSIVSSLSQKKAFDIAFPAPVLGQKPQAAYDVAFSKDFFFHFQGQFAFPNMLSSFVQTFHESESGREI